MTSFSDHLLQVILPLYVFIALGAILGRGLKVDSRPIAMLMFYILFPTVVFDGIRQMELTLTTALLPVFTWCLATILCLTFMRIGKLAWGKADTRAGILGLSAGTANCGYFGLPIAMLVFDAQGVALYIALFTGLTIFESSVGFYVTARGQHTPRDSLIKVLKLPSLYAFLAALCVNGANLPMPDFYNNMMGHVKGAYVFCGMLVIGLGLAQVNSLKIGPRFLVLALLATFVAWPAMSFGVIWLDQHFFNLLHEEIYKGLILLSIVPLAANTVAIATLLNAHPEKVATAVLISTLIAGFYVPWMAERFLQ